MRRFLSFGGFAFLGRLSFAFALAAIPASQAAADELESADLALQVVPPDALAAGMKIERVIATGNGCPDGSFRGYLANAGQRFNLRFVGLTPEISPRSQIVSGRCRLAIYVRVPEGVQFEVQQFSYAGYALLDPDVSAEVAASYYFDDDRARRHEVRTTFRGPFDDTFMIEDRATDGGIWSPCGRRQPQVLNVDIEVVLRNDGQTGEGVVDIEEARGVDLRYRRCS